MATIVLVHGAWGGGWAWKFVAPLLRAQGHEVFTPTLTGLGQRVHLASPKVNLDTHIRDIVNHLQYEDMENVLLVGWSYSGMVITGVRDLVPQRIGHVVYLDAEVPRDGESEFDVAGAEFREEMEHSARTSGEGWRASMGKAEDIDDSSATGSQRRKRGSGSFPKWRRAPSPLKHFVKLFAFLIRLLIWCHVHSSVARWMARCGAIFSNGQEIQGRKFSDLIWHHNILQK